MLLDLARKDRGLLLGLVVVTLLTVTLLASGLSSVEIQSSRQFSLDFFRRVADLANISMPSSAFSALAFLAGFLRVLLLILLPFSIYYFIRSSKARKRVLIQLLYLVGFTYLILALSQSLGQSPMELTPEPLPVDTSTLVAPDVIAGTTEVPGLDVRRRQHSHRRFIGHHHGSCLPQVSDAEEIRSRNGIRSPLGFGCARSGCRT